MWNIPLTEIIAKMPLKRWNRRRMNFGSPQVSGEMRCAIEYHWGMKMLPLLPDGQKKVVRDAARAVKREADLMIERVTTNTLSTLLGLPGMVVTEYAIVVCPRCGQVSDALHEQEGRCIRHLDI
ncbi:MAG: hypothetical protein ACOYYU_04805 [Chloroflexota bacterium]